VVEEEDGGAEDFKNVFTRVVDGVCDSSWWVSGIDVSSAAARQRQLECSTGESEGGLALLSVLRVSPKKTSSQDGLFYKRPDAMTIGIPWDELRAQSASASRAPSSRSRFQIRVSNGIPYGKRISFRLLGE
jgi:hypothetical protein